MLATLATGAIVAAADEPGRWNSAPYMATAPLVTSNDQDLDAAIKMITRFPLDLDPRLWDGEKLRPDVRARILEVVNQQLADLKIPDLRIAVIETQGSTISYEYDEDSDLSARAFLDTSAYKGNVEDLSALLKLYTNYLEKMHEGQVTVRGVPLEVQFYAIKSDRLKPEKGIGHYSISDDVWIERPTQQPDRFDHDQMLVDARHFIAAYNNLMTDYFAAKKGFDCERFAALSKEMRDYRHAGIMKNGTRSTANLTYRMLRRLNVNVSETTRMVALECQNIQWTLE
jgi:hypothetical protein